MKSIEEMRCKHWSNRKELWPRKQSHCQVKFEHIGLVIRAQALMAAQDDAKDALTLAVAGERKEAEKYFNRANFLLTAAYMGDERNDGFWRQF
jgi:hypothetical protein